MPSKGQKFFTVLTPEFDTPVITGRGEHPAVGTEMNAIDWLVMPSDRFKFFTVLAPEFEAII
jgi:hypothetical protein